MSTKELIASLEGLIIVEDSKKKMYDDSEALFRIASREQDHKGMMVSDFYFGCYYYFYEHNLSKATQYVKSCSNEAKELNDESYLLKSSCLEVMINVALYSPFSACEAFLKCQSLAAKLNERRIEAIINNYLGDIFAILKDYQKANFYYQQSKEEFEHGEFTPDILQYKAIADYIINNIRLKRYDIIDSSVNLGMMRFSGTKMILIFRCLKEILALFKRLSYIERSIVDDIYHIFMHIEDIDDIYTKIRLLIILYPLVDRTDDIQLINEYVELLDAYAAIISDMSVLDEIAEIKNGLLGLEEGNNEYIKLISTKNALLTESLDLSIRMVLSLNEASEERDNEIEKNKTLLKISSTDELTKLYNRRYGVQLIEESLVDPTKAAYAFIMLDIDDFKSINDNYGHGTGDEALVFLSKTMQEIFDKDSIVVRLAGDEFVVLLYNLPTDINIRRSVVLYKLDLLKKYLKDSKLQFLEGNTMSVSMGVSLEGENFDKMYSNADVALYDSKYGGKGRYSVFGDEEKSEEQ